MWALIAAGHKQKRVPELCNGRRWRKDDCRCGWRASEPCLSQPLSSNTYLTLYRWPLIIIIKKHKYRALFFFFFSFQPDQLFSVALWSLQLLIHMLMAFLGTLEVQEMAPNQQASRKEMFPLSPVHWLADGDVRKRVRVDNQTPSHHLPCSTSTPWNESFPLLCRSWTPGSLQKGLFICPTM